MDKKFYELPRLNYGAGELSPFLSEEQLTIHYEKHHQAYVKGANAILEKIDKSRNENADLDIKAIAKDFSFQIGGHILHSLFWENLAPNGQGGGGEPEDRLLELIISQFGTVERFKKEFTQGALSVEGSGWTAVIYCMHTGRLLFMQIEKHNVNVIPGHKIIMVIDVFEHAYYLDYKNDREKYIEAFWSFINWQKVNDRLKMAIK